MSATGGSAAADLEYRRHRPNWWRAPQRLWLRRAAFQMHLWLGVVLALYAAVIGLSGSALVFKDQIDHLTQGRLLQTGTSAQRISLEHIIRDVERNRPGWRIIGIDNLNLDDSAPVFLLQPSGRPPSADYRMVYFNPHTGRVLLDRRRFSGALGFLCNLHFYLLAGKTGLAVSGWMALGLLFLCISGLVLWWPGIQRWRAALVLRRRARFRRFLWDLHAVVGFWSCAGLLLLTFTGLYFAFPGAVMDLVVLATGSSPHAARAVLQPKHARVARGSGPLLTADQALAAARNALPADAPPGYMALPQRPEAPFYVTGYYRDTAPYSQLVSLTLDPHTGSVLSRQDTRAQIGGLRIIQYFFALHFGSFAGEGVLGILVRLIWVLLGIAPAVLGATGLYMYWNRKLRPAWQRIHGHHVSRKA